MHKPHTTTTIHHRIGVRPVYLSSSGIKPHRWTGQCACGWAGTPTTDKRDAIRAASDHMVNVVADTTTRVILTIAVAADDGD